MKKYFFIFKSELMSSLQYIGNILFGFIGYTVMLFILFNLWRYLYSDPNEVINGYTMNQMVWYVLTTEVLWAVLGGRKFCKKICDDVRGGNIAYNINKPYNYIGFTIASHLGELLLKFIIYSLLALGLGYLFLGSFPSLSLLSVSCVILTMIFATTISILLITFIGLFSFYIEDATPFYWVYSKIILVLGTIFPIEYFPKVMQPIIKFSPVYVVSYGPAKLFVDYSTSKFILIILAQIIYILIAYLLCVYIYKKGVRKLNVNGG